MNKKPEIIDPEEIRDFMVNQVDAMHRLVNDAKKIPGHECAVIVGKIFIRALKNEIAFMESFLDLEEEGEVC